MRARRSATWLTTPTARPPSRRLVQDRQHLLQAVLVERAEPLVDEEGLQVEATGLLAHPVGEPESQRQRRHERLATGQASRCHGPDRSTGPRSPGPSPLRRPPATGASEWRSRYLPSPMVRQPLVGQLHDSLQPGGQNVRGQPHPQDVVRPEPGQPCRPAAPPRHGGRIWLGTLRGCSPTSTRRWVRSRSHCSAMVCVRSAMLAGLPGLRSCWPTPRGRPRRHSTAWATSGSSRTVCACTRSRSAWARTRSCADRVSSASSAAEASRTEPNPCSDSWVCRGVGSSCRHAPGRRRGHCIESTSAGQSGGHGAWRSRIVDPGPLDVGHAQGHPAVCRSQPLGQLALGPVQLTPHGAQAPGRLAAAVRLQAAPAARGQRPARHPAPRPARDVGEPSMAASACVAALAGRRRGLRRGSARHDLRRPAPTAEPTPGPRRSPPRSEPSPARRCRSA